MWLIIGGVVVFVALLMFILARSISNADSRQKEWEDTGPQPSIYAETHGRLRAVRPPKVESTPGMQQVYTPQGQQGLQPQNPLQPQHNQLHHTPNFNSSHHGNFNEGVPGGGHHY